jgi:hypothetical protein
MFTLGVFLAATAIADEPIPRPSTETTLRNDGVMLVNGKPVIPCGFYISTGHTGELRIRCVELMAEAGFNAIHIEGPWHEDTAFLDRAAELGIHVIAGHTETEDKLWRVRKFKDHPAIIAWTIHDDANTKSDLAQLRKMNRLIKEAAPHQLTFIPIGAQSRTVPMPANGFFDCSDVVGWENYPIGCRTVADPTARTGELQMAQARAVATKYRRPVWVLPQTFAWPGERLPTPAEFRNLCYVGLINNAKGVLPWSIYYKGDDEAARAAKRARNDPHVWDPWFLPDHPDLWDGCKAFASELRALTPILIDGRYTRLDAGSDASAASWQMADSLTVILASLESSRAIRVSISLPGAPLFELKSLFTSQSTAVKLSEGKLEVELEPVAVHVYQVSTSERSKVPTR